jgi:hypothetical protein
MAGEFRVPKTRIEVELAVRGYAPRRVEVFLAKHGARPFEPQGLLRLLEQGGDFLPASDPESGTVLLFSKHAVLWIALSAAVGTGVDGQVELFNVRREVAVDLVDGSRLQGQLLFSAPPRHTRVADHMNETALFFRLFRAEDVVFINKRMVSRIAETAAATQRRQEAGT